MYPLLATVVVVLGIMYIVRVARGLKRLSAKSCAALISSMSYIDFAQICSVARSFQVGDSARSGATEALTLQLGGLEGLRRIFLNAGMMLQIARYLLLTNPEAGGLARQIRLDAIRLRRMVLTLLLRHYLGIWHRSNPLTVSTLAKLYITLSINMDESYLRIADDLMIILQEVNNGHSRVRRAVKAAAAVPVAL